MTTPKAFLLGCVAAAFVAGSPFAVAAPQSTPTVLDRTTIATTSPLTADQAKTLDAFVEGWTNVIASTSNAKDLADARRTLIEPLRDPSATAVFRRAFSGASVSRLEPIVNGKDTQRAIVAMQVARFVGTPESLELIVGRLSTEKESDVAKRLSAASTIGFALGEVDLTAVQFDTLTRAIAAAAEKEREALVLLQEVRALAEFVKRPKAPAASTEQARTSQVKVLRSLMAQLATANGADAMVQVVNQALITLRDQWTNLPQADQMKLGPVLAPALAELFAIGAKQWDAAHDVDARGGPRAQSYSDAIAAAEVLLRIVDKTVRPSGGGIGAEKAIAKAWDANDRKAFDDEVAKWTKVVAAAPYR